MKRVTVSLLLALVVSCRGGRAYWTLEGQGETAPPTAREEAPPLQPPPPIEAVPPSAVVAKNPVQEAMDEADRAIAEQEAQAKKEAEAKPPEVRLAPSWRSGDRLPPSSRGFIKIIPPEVVLLGTNACLEIGDGTSWRKWTGVQAPDVEVEIPSQEGTYSVRFSVEGKGGSRIVSSEVRFVVAVPKAEPVAKVLPKGPVEKAVEDADRILVGKVAEKPVEHPTPDSAPAVEKPIERLAPVKVVVDFGAHKARMEAERRALEAVSGGRDSQAGEKIFEERWADIILEVKAELSRHQR